MGYHCDSCTQAPASVFCLSCSDKQMLCKGCDERSHNNKAFHKHERLSLASTAEKPNCDICQDNKAVVFCTEDRALMCRGCDMMVHAANAAVGRHTRHLLTGWIVGLTALPAPGEAASSADTLTTGPAVPPKPPVTSANLADGSVPAANTAAKPPTGRGARGGAYRANGAADYEDYGALRTLLGYPTPNPPPSASRKAQNKQTKQQQPQQQAYASTGPMGMGLPLGAPPGGMRSLQHSMMGVSAGGPAGSLGPSGGPAPSNYAGMLTASELLGMPLDTDLSAKDIDAVFLPDTYTALDDFDVDFSSLFAVPDFGPPSSEESGGRAAHGSDPFADLQQQQELGMPPLLDDEDGLVPDLFGAPTSKRRRK